MSAQYDNNLRGALFKNEAKDGERDPDYKGSAEINGAQFWLAAWIKTAKSGKKYMSLSFKPKEAVGEKKAAPSRALPDEFDDIAF